MNQANRDIDEFIAGMYDALGSKPEPEWMTRKVQELRAEQERNERDDWHGWECYCNSCCT